MKQAGEKEVGTYEARNCLSALVEEASRGTRIWITRHGKRVALLSSGVGATHQPNAASPVDTLRRIRKRARPGPESIKDLIEEGRR
jgi:prevent-host-death family protein